MINVINPTIAAVRQLHSLTENVGLILKTLSKISCIYVRNLQCDLVRRLQCDLVLISDSEKRQMKVCFTQHTKIFLLDNIYR